MDKLLPIGSVVKLDKDSELLYMIVGYYPYENDKDIVYTYSGVFYPTGIVNDNSFVMFNDSIIEEIVFKGYMDDEVEEYMVEISELMKIE